MKNFLKSFFSFGLATTVEKLTAFLLLPIYTRFFTKVEFGAIDLLQVILGVSSIFAVLQLETSLQRYYYTYKGIIKKLLISTTVYSIFILSIVITIVLNLFSNEISLLIFDGGQYSSLIKLASLQLPFTTFSMLGFVLLRYEKKNVKFVIFILIRVFSNLAFIFFFVVWLKMGIQGVFYSQLLSVFLTAILLFFSIRSLLAIGFSPQILKKSLKYALPQFPARIGSVTLTYANRFFMIGYLTVASIGIYSLSLKLASSVQLIYSAFIMAWAPFMFEQKKNKNHKDIFANVLLIVASPVFFLVCGIALFSKEIVVFIADPEFYESYQYVGGLSLYFSLFIFKEIVDIGPKFTEKTKYLSFTFFCSVIINVLSLFILIKYFGLYGVVYSMLLTNVFLLTMSWIVSNRLYYIPYNYIKFIFLAGPAFIVSIYLMYFLPPLEIRLVLIFVTLIFYFLTGWKNYKSIRASLSKQN